MSHYNNGGATRYGRAGATAPAPAANQQQTAQYWLFRTSDKYAGHDITIPSGTVFRKGSYWNFLDLGDEEKTWDEMRQILGAPGHHTAIKYPMNRDLDGHVFKSMYEAIKKAAAEEAEQLVTQSEAAMPSTVPAPVVALRRQDANYFVAMEAEAQPRRTQPRKSLE